MSMKLVIKSDGEISSIELELIGKMIAEGYTRGIGLPYGVNWYLAEETDEQDEPCDDSFPFGVH